MMNDACDGKNLSSFTLNSPPAAAAGGTVGHQQGQQCSSSSEHRNHGNRSTTSRQAGEYGVYGTEYQLGQLAPVWPAVYGGIRYIAFLGQYTAIYRRYFGVPYSSVKRFMACLYRLDPRRLFFSGRTKRYVFFFVDL